MGWGEAVFLCFMVWRSMGSVHGQGQKPLDPLEVEALKKIGSELGKQWNFSVDPCSGTSGWMDTVNHSNNNYYANNVTCGACSADYCYVVNITLKAQNLNGSLPDAFSSLPFLRIIDLTRNYLNGTIPSSWASLNLTKLSMGGNRISGNIPKELGDITTLQILEFPDNLIEGHIPQNLGKLINLNRIFLSGNNITGELPVSLANLKNLSDFRISGNPISGKIPDFIGNWKELERLDMQGTSLEGPFPLSFSKLQKITTLSVSDLKGGDGVLQLLNDMKKMKQLVLRNLSISGVLPESILNMPNIITLDLSFNNLTGPIPSSYESLTNLKFLYLTNNSLTGAIPDWILNTQYSMDLSYNSFDGFNLPGTCPITGHLNLVSSCSSSTSNSIASCMKRNHPCSEKPTNYNLFINCGGNKVTFEKNEYEEDTYPNGQSSYKSVGDRWAYSSTGRFKESENEYYIVSSTTTLNMSNPELYVNARLSPLSLKYYGLCLQNGNYTVNLHFAEIMFTDDQTYSAVGRRLFDVSIQGEKVLRDFNIAKEANGTGRNITKSFNASVSENTLEIHFQWAGKGTSTIPHAGVYGPLISAISVTPNFDPDLGEHNLSTASILGIVAAGCAVIALISIFIWYCRRRKNAENKELRGLLSQTGCFTFRQLKDATMNFAPENKIGEGGFGSVYKGVLPNGSLIAVKQLSSKSRQGNREFINEIGMISALQHPNLVKLLGCCIEGSQLLLIYEYMENNSLASVLFGPETNRLKLDWQTRRRICLDVARGLAYLHEESRLKVVHRDIKATNVLLDKDLNAKISDFGLARLAEDDVSHISTRIAGTIGYMAPEYGMRGILTDKADVYSFGVVMLEIVTGVSNANYKQNEGIVSLLDWAYVQQQKGDLLELVDKSLGSNYTQEEALQILNLALTCTNPSRTLRPTMSSVVSSLDGQNPQAVSSTTKLTISRIDDDKSTSVSTDRKWFDSSVSGTSNQEESTVNSTEKQASF